MIAIQKRAATVSSIEWADENNLFWVLNKPAFWPHSIIGNANEKNIKNIIGKVNAKELPPFWILDKEKSINQIRTLEDNGFKEINRWEGMYIEKHEFNYKAKLANDIKFELVKNDELYEDWISVVKSTLMKNKSFSNELKVDWINNPDIILMLGMEKQNPVCSGMAFIENNIAGLYLIATFEEKQGKGFGSLLVSNLINICLDRGVKEIVLHSTLEGKKMYQKMGFKENGIISTFWKVGMF